MTAGDLLRKPAALASASLQLGRDVGNEALDAGRSGQRAIARAAEQAMLGALDAVVGRLLEEQVIDRILARVEATEVAPRVLERLLSDGVVEQAAERVISGPELERIIAAAFETTLPDELIAKLLASEALWVLVDEIARSPSVTDAIAHQGTGFAEQVAAKARDRSRQADSEVQRFANRFSRRQRSAKPDSSSAPASALPGEPEGASGPR